jgi:hypothetical protein
MTDTLGMSGEAWVDLDEALSDAFPGLVTEQELESLETLGDLHRLLLSRLGEDRRAAGACISSMAFYRLRRALRDIAPGVEVRPSTPLAAVGFLRSQTLAWTLRRRTGLDMPARVTWLSYVGSLGLFGFPVFLALGWQGLIAAAGLLALIPFDQGRLSGRCRTVGELAERAAALNYARLAEAGGRVREAELWNALTGLFRRELGPLSPETRLAG